jgi:hypothetical protein
MQNRKQTPLPSPPTLKGASQGGEAKTLLNQDSVLENRLSHQPTSPLPTATLAPGASAGERADTCTWRTPAPGAGAGECR